MSHARHILLLLALFAPFTNRMLAKDEPAPGRAKPASCDETIASRMERLQQLPQDADPLRPPQARPSIDRKLSIDFSFGQPADTAFEFLGDASGVEIILPRGRFRDRRVKLDRQELTIDEALSIVCAQAGLDWDTDGYIIYVGSAGDLRRFRRLVSTRDTRRDHYPEEIAQSLQKRVSFDFDDTVLESAIGWLSQMIDVPMRLAPDAKLPKQRLWFTASVPADIALDLMSIKYGFTWSIEPDGAILLRYLPDEL